MAKTELYFVTDIETDGPIPGPHSMLSFASAAYTDAGELLGTFSANLNELPNAKGHPKTMKWWASEPQAWAACRNEPQEPKAAMNDFVKWIRQLCGKTHSPVFVGYPAGFDFTFIFWYLVYFTGDSPFSWSALDMKTMAMSLTDLPYKQAIKPKLPKEWLPENLPHTHVALDDALEQGAIFCAMLKEWQTRQT
ncbi:MAG: 3'-5' exoribonuclease domain-containing protein [Formosimonas sp.]